MGFLDYVMGISSQISYFFKHEWYFYWNRLTHKYYIIRRSHMGAGFFSNYNWVMGHIVFARRLGYIPVVDMENYKTLYSEDEPIGGGMNAWNYYFENVGKVDLKEAYAGKYVLGEDRALRKYAEKFCGKIYRYPSDKAVDFYYPIIQEYIRIRPEIQKSFEDEWSKMMQVPSLGVHIRGTDMRNDLGHPVPVTVEKYMEKAGDMLKDNPDLKVIFLATDEEDVIEKFQKKFSPKGIPVQYNDAFRAGTRQRTGIHEMEVKTPRKQHKYRMGMEVLKDAWFLSKCEYLLCGHSNITNVAIIWNNHAYREVVCLDNE